MGKNIVVCCDGTGNEVENNLSNILKLFRVAEKSERQRVFYTPGVGTIAHRDPWLKFKQEAYGVFGLATGWGLDDEVLAAYRFIAATYAPGDDIFLFGFSRGAYSVRVLAGFMRMIGVLPPDQINLADFALPTYKQASEDNHFDSAWQFGRVTGCRHVPIAFMGVFDTVSSVIVPGRHRFVPFLLTLPYTARNDSIRVVRHAMALDERRRMFRLNAWTEPQPFLADPFETHVAPVPQDIKQVWFTGVHSDVGGGYPEAESGLSKFPLAWMIAEAKGHGLEVDDHQVDHLVFGAPRPRSPHRYVPPDATAELHDSETAGWRVLEYIPKSAKLQEWPRRRRLLGHYIPDAEPRLVDNAKAVPRLHRSVVDRRDAMPDYRPINFPGDFEIEPWPPHAFAVSSAEAG